MADLTTVVKTDADAAALTELIAAKKKETAIKVINETANAAIQSHYDAIRDIETQRNADIKALDK